jgi:hypothetical protein
MGDVSDRIDELDLPGFTVDNDSETPITQLAFEVLQRTGWPRPPRSELS